MAQPSVRVLGEVRPRLAREGLCPIADRMRALAPSPVELVALAHPVAVDAVADHLLGQFAGGVDVEARSGEYGLGAIVDDHTAYHCAGEVFDALGEPRAVDVCEQPRELPPLPRRRPGPGALRLAAHSRRLTFRSWSQSMAETATSGSAAQTRIASA